jgi:hypothetical protein
VELVSYRVELPENISVPSWPAEFSVEASVELYETADVAIGQNPLSLP